MWLSKRKPVPNNADAEAVKSELASLRSRCDELEQSRDHQTLRRHLQHHSLDGVGCLLFIEICHCVFDGDCFSTEAEGLLELDRLGEGFIDVLEQDCRASAYCRRVESLLDSMIEMR